MGNEGDEKRMFYNGKVFLGREREMKKITIIMTMLVLSMAVGAQVNRHQLREGNRQYKKQHYDKAEVAYRKALERDSVDFRGQYNLANDLYRQEKYEEASRHYQQALAGKNVTEKQRAQALHNQGNSYFKAAQQSEQMQGLQQAVNCYQEALKLDPKNDDTRYNLAYARRLLQQQQQQQGGGQNQQNQDQQNQQNQQQQNQQQNQEQQQQNQDLQQNRQNQQEQPQDQLQNQRRQQQQAGQDQRKQDAERMLEAVKNNEKQTLRDKARAEKPVRVKRTEKDW